MTIKSIVFVREDDVNFHKLDTYTIGFIRAINLSGDVPCFYVTKLGGDTNSFHEEDLKPFHNNWPGRTWEEL